MLVVLFLLIGGGVMYYGMKKWDWFSDKKSEQTTDSADSTTGDEKISTHADIRVISVTSNQKIDSPLIIAGEAKGTWFFEAEFTVRLVDQNNEELAIGIARTESDWMTESVIPFSVELTFDPGKATTGDLVFEKSNPSDLAENADEFRLPVTF